MSPKKYLYLKFLGGCSFNESLDILLDQQKETQRDEDENEYNQVIRTSQVLTPHQDKHKQVLGI